MRKVLKIKIKKWKTSLSAETTENNFQNPKKTEISTVCKIVVVK